MIGTRATILGRTAAVLLLIVVTYGCGGSSRTGGAARGHAPAPGRAMTSEPGRASSPHPTKPRKLGYAHPTGPRKLSPAGTPVAGDPELPTLISWHRGEQVRATSTVAWQETSHATGGSPTLLEVRLEETEQLRVTAVSQGTATLQLHVTRWRWQQSASELHPTSFPSPATIVVDDRGRVLGGEGWLLPGSPPVPGAVLLAAPLPGGPELSWSRTDAGGLPLVYTLTSRPSADSAEVSDELAWSTARRAFTAAGDLMTTDASATASVSTRYRPGRVLSLAATQEQARYDRTTTTVAGAVAATGTLTIDTTFQDR